VHVAGAMLVVDALPPVNHVATASLKTLAANMFGCQKLVSEQAAVCLGFFRSI